MRGEGSVGRVRVQFQKVRKKYNSTIVQKVRKKYKKYTKSTSGFVAGFVQLVYQCGGKKKGLGAVLAVRKMLSAQSYKRLLKNVRVVGSGRPYGTMVLWYYGRVVATPCAQTTSRHHL